MIQGCGRRCCPGCRPSMRAAWWSAKPATGTPTGGSVFPVYRLEVPSPPMRAPARPPPPPPRGPHRLRQGQRGCGQLFLSGRHREVGGREATPTAPHRRVFRLGPTPRFGSPQKRQRMASETVEAGSQAQGAQRRVSPPPPPSSDHRHRHHHQVRRRHPQGSSSRDSERPAFRVAGRSRAPSKCAPFLFFHWFSYHFDRY
jgi:hypothetical protein